jgi:predicted N-acetyltransferase YhbS
MSDVRVRRAQECDADPIFEIFNEDAAQSTLDDVVQFLRTDHGGGFVARDGNADAGAVLFSQQGAVFWVVRLAVLEKSRGRGIGAALMRAVEARAASDGAGAVLVQVAAEAGVAPYFERLGYEIDHREPDAARGAPITLVDLIKVL